MAFELGNVFRNKKIPTIFGIIVLLLGVIAGVVLVSSQSGLSFFTKAGPTSTPRQVRISNITETGFTVSWISDTSVSGFLKYGVDQKTLDKTFADDRDRTSGKTGLFTTHFITVSGLKPNTPYYFTIGSGSASYDDSGAPYTVTTAKAATKPAADTISGKVLLPSGQPASGAIVYVEVDGGAPLSALTKNSGAWSMSLSTMRTKDLEGYLQYDKSTAKVSIFAQAAELGTATLTTTTAEDSPVADITLGQSQDLAGSANRSASAVITISSQTFNPAELSVAVGQIVTVINNDPTEHSITTQNNEFATGTIAANGGTGTFIAPATPGTYSFFDSLNPQLESLVGTLTVTPALATAQNFVPTTTPAAIPTIAISAAPLATTSGIGGMATPSAVQVVSIIEGEKIATDSPEIAVRGPVGTKVKITVNSEVTQTKDIVLDADGLVTWTPPSDLEPGEHTVTLEYVDAAGKPVVVTKKFTVLALATPTPSKAGTSSLLTTPTYSATRSATITYVPTSTTSGRTSMPSTAAAMPVAGVLTPTIILSVLGMGLLLMGLGFQVRLIPTNIYK